MQSINFRVTTYQSSGEVWYWRLDWADKEGNPNTEQGSCSRGENSRQAAARAAKDKAKRLKNSMKSLETKMIRI